MQDVFVFKIEGTGVLPPEDIVRTAFNILIAKLLNLKQNLEQLALS